MNELQNIAARYARVRREGGVAALATVVRVTGSTYRRPGARMLITDDRGATGCVSGGCLESDVVEQARRVMLAGQPRVLTYRSDSDSDIVWGFGLGCNGTVDILIERLAAGEYDPLAFIADCLERRREGVIATVLPMTGETCARAGGRLLLQRGDAEHRSGIADDAISQAVLVDAREALDGEAHVRTCRVPGGCVDVFFDVIRPPLPLVIFGAGHDAEPLVRLAKGMGWHVTVVDHRVGRIAEAREWSADAAILAHPKELVQISLQLQARVAVVIMNHNFLHDLDTLRFVLTSPVRYIGVLGPQQRTMRLISDLSREGVAISQTELDRIYGPVGLDIGADNPEEIALSIMAEIAAVAAERPGTFLRDRSRPLHTQREARRADRSDVAMMRDVVEVHCETSAAPHG